jgi:hypothetical protein
LYRYGAEFENTYERGTALTFTMAGAPCTS